jgi:hypothetical protein
VLGHLSVAIDSPTRPGRLDRQRRLPAQIDDALAKGATPARKALLQALVHEVRAESRDKIVPWFRVRGGEPSKVRALGGLAPPAGLEPATHGLGNRRSIL